ncbi:MAG TPA: hypothetical protein VK616_13390 [Flavitalea sp.]|nr:hypothetical protein [Flavitalea sp.]
MTHHYLFREGDMELVQVAKTLMIPSRVSILRILFHEDIWVTEDVFQKLGLEGKVLHKHIDALISIDLIARKTENTITYYGLKIESFSRYKNGLLSILKKDNP